MAVNIDIKTKDNELSTKIFASCNKVYIYGEKSSLTDGSGTAIFY